MHDVHHSSHNRVVVIILSSRVVTQRTSHHHIKGCQVEQLSGIEAFLLFHQRCKLLHQNAGLFEENANVGFQHIVLETWSNHLPIHTPLVQRAIAQNTVPEEMLCCEIEFCLL